MSKVDMHETENMVRIMLNLRKSQWPPKPDHSNRSVQWEGKKFLVLRPCVLHLAVKEELGTQVSRTLAVLGSPPYDPPSQWPGCIVLLAAGPWTAGGGIALIVPLARVHRPWTAGGGIALIVPLVRCALHSGWARVHVRLGCARVDPQALLAQMVAPSHSFQEMGKSSLCSSSQLLLDCRGVSHIPPTAPHFFFVLPWAMRARSTMTGEKFSVGMGVISDVYVRGETSRRGGDQPMEVQTGARELAR
ncbi:hypothetical protein K438DRAFT_1789805 [Mycena galopus ATCC 62051]|nr:hypothetical protein K438DRAFT_1789805 [Mycena galopus ATCC 62051]